MTDRQTDGQTAGPVLRGANGALTLPRRGISPPPKDLRGFGEGAKKLLICNRSRLTNLQVIFAYYILVCALQFIALVSVSVS